MKQRTMAVIGVTVTAVLMVLLLACVILYEGDSGNGPYMMGMASLSSGLMVFLIIFAVLYGRRASSTSLMYAERYHGVCSVCGGRFGPDGICPGCGRVRPPMVRYG